MNRHFDNRIRRAVVPTPPNALARTRVFADPESAHDLFSPLITYRRPAGKHCGRAHLDRNSAHQAMLRGEKEMFIPLRSQAMTGWVLFTGGAGAAPPALPRISA